MRADPPEEGTEPRRRWDGALAPDGAGGWPELDDESGHDRYGNPSGGPDAHLTAPDAEAMPDAQPVAAAHAARADRAAARRAGAQRAARAVGHGAAVSGRYAVRGGRGAGRLVGTGTRAGTRRFRSFAGADGAKESGLARLIEVHAVSAAGDAAFTVSLAGTVLAMPAGQARGQVAIFLLTTMVPFVLLSPVIGPLLDRFRHGRRWAIGTTLAVRAFLSWVMAGLVVEHSAWLLPVALVSLVAARAYAVATVSAIPRVVPDSITLVTANSRHTIASLIGMGLGSVIAGAAGRIGPDWALRVAFLIYVVATVIAITLPQQVDSAAEPKASRPFGPVRRTPTKVRVRALMWPTLSRPVRTSLAITSGSRLLQGFLIFYIGFLVSQEPPADLSGVVALAVVAVAAGVGNVLGGFIGNRLGKRRPARVAAGMLLLATVCTAATAVFYARPLSLSVLIALGLVTGSFGQLSRLCLSAVVQRDTPEENQSKVFAVNETRLQMAWVVGGGLGTVLPLIPWLGFGVVFLLLAGVAGWVWYSEWTARAGGQR